MCPVLSLGCVKWKENVPLRWLLMNQTWNTSEIISCIFAITVRKKTVHAYWFLWVFPTCTVICSPRLFGTLSSVQHELNIWRKTALKTCMNWSWSDPVTQKCFEIKSNLMIMYLLKLCNILHFWQLFSSQFVTIWK